MSDSRNGLPGAVLWDMDGTLVDTEPYWIDSEFELVAEHGRTWTLEDAHSLVGNDLMVSARLLRERGGVRLSEEEIVDRLVAQVAAKVREHVPWRPGALELLDALRQAHVPCALVTMSYVALVDAVLVHLPDGTFAEVVTGDAVHNGKPHPEPYLTAMRRLGVGPDECVALEDSLTGLRSAEAAGVPTVGIRNVVELTAAPGRTVVDTLVGVSPARLAEWARAATSPADVAET